VAQVRKDIWKDELEEMLESQVWWCIPVILALGRQRQGDPKFKASLSQNKNKTNKKQR
jgi:hypothetical protein